MFRLKLSDGSTFGSYTSKRAAQLELRSRPGRIERHVGNGVWAALAAIAMLLAPVVANAATTDGKGRKVEWTADRYAREQQLQCTYGAPRFETDAHGRTIIVTSKICKGASR